MRSRVARSAVALGSAGLVVLSMAGCQQSKPGEETSQSKLKIVEQVQIDGTVRRSKRRKALRPPIRPATLAFALREGLLDALAMEAIALSRQALPGWLDENAADFVQTVQRTRQLATVDMARLKQTLSELVARHAGSKAS